MSSEYNKLYEFGKFQLDVTERVLLCEDNSIILAPKVFDTLEILVKRSGKIVSKKDLMNEVWANSFVEESNLTQNIYKLRQTLGKEFIETVPRRGYRFTASVKSSTLEQKRFSDSNIDTGLIVATKTKTHIIEREETDFSETIENTALTKTQETNLFGKKSLIIATLAIASIFVLGFVGYQSFVNQTSENLPTVLTNIEFDKLTATGNAYSPVISPDGKFLAYLKASDIGKTLNLMDIESGNDVELDIGNDVKPDFLQFSPTGKRIYIRSQGRLESPQEIYETSYFGGQAKLVAKDVWGHFSISPDGKKLAFYRSKPAENKKFLIVKDLENNEEKEYAERNVTDSFFMYVSPAWSSDGKKIAFVPVKEKSNRSEIVFINLKDSEEETIETELTYIRQMSFLPNEKGLILVARDKTFQIHKLDYTTGKSIRITNDVNNYRNISMTADGSKIVTQQRKLESNIWLIPNAEINLAEPLTEKGFYGLYDLKYTKTGDVIFDSKGKINRDLELVNAKNKASRIISKDENTNNNHEPSSDKLGNIYFVSDQSDSMNIWRVNPNGDDSKQITFGKKGEFNIAPTVSPDEKWLYFIKRSDESNSIWKTSLTENDKLEKVFEAKGFSFGRFLSISPDGKWLAFHYLKGKQTNTPQTTRFSGKPKFGFINLLNTSEMKIFEVPTNRTIIRWTNGGKSFDYYTTKLNEGKIWRQDFENKLAPPQIIFQMPESRIMHFDWSPDEKDLVITRGINQSDAVMLKLAE